MKIITNLAKVNEYSLIMVNLRISGKPIITNCKIILKFAMGVKIQNLQKEVPRINAPTSKSEADGRTHQKLDRVRAGKLD